jgi:uncharacterized membrane protein YeaQ/YmgE (transglycosylase-associated protein family)
MLIGVIGWVVLGTLFGFVASKMIDLRGDDPNLGIGIGAAGGLIGGWIYSLHTGMPVSAFNQQSLLSAAFVAIIVLLAWHAWRWKSAA